MRRLLTVFVIMVSAFAVSGCSTIADAKAAKGSGTVRIYDKPYDVVWEAVIGTLKGTSLSIASESKSEGVSLRRAASAYSLGARTSQSSLKMLVGE
jgi:uncharacterized protein YceK